MLGLTIVLEKEGQEVFYIEYSGISTWERLILAFYIITHPVVVIKLPDGSTKINGGIEYKL